MWLCYSVGWSIVQEHSLIVPAQEEPPMPVGFEDRKKSGSLAAAQDVVTINAPGSSTISAQVTGTFSGTITWEASTDQTNYVAINAQKVATGTIATTTTGTGLFIIQAGGSVVVRARMSS